MYFQAKTTLKNNFYHNLKHVVVMFEIVMENVFQSTFYLIIY